MLTIKQIYPKLFNFEDYKSLHAVSKKKKIMIFSLSFIWIKYLTLLSSVFVLKNCNVTLIWSKFFFQDNQDQEQNKYEINELRKSFKEKVKNFSAFEIDELKEKDEIISEDEFKKIYDQSKIDTMLVKKKVRIDIKNEERDFFNKRLEINQSAYKKLKSYLKNNKFDRIIFPNGALYEWAIARLVCENLKIEFMTLESHFTHEDDVILTRKNASCLKHDDEQVQKLWEKNYPYHYDDEKKKTFQKFYKKINSKSDGLSLQLMSKDIESNKLKQKLKISNNDIVCLITPSFSYEKHSRLKKYCFKDHSDWIVKTIDYIKNKKAKFIIKCHPIPYDPVNDSYGFKNRSENPEQIIKRNFETLPKNLMLILPEERISINSLINISDFGISYFSRSSIEMAWQSKKSMVCSNIHFSNKEFVDTPKNVIEYYKFIDHCCENKKNCKLDKKLTDLSRYYVDVWWRQMSDKMQWNITRGSYNYRKYTFDKVLSLKFMVSEYSRTFDKLIGNNTPDKHEIFEGYINKIKFKKNQKTLLKYEKIENIIILFQYFFLRKREYIPIILSYFLRYLMKKYFLFNSK